jgi:hypothetical protein
VRSSRNITSFCRRNAARISRVGITVAVPLTGASLIVRDSGHQSGLWDALGLIGVVLVVLAVLVQCYDLYVNWATRPKRSRDRSS